jgi:hypothetical protein
VPEVRRASVDDAKLEEFQALLGACEHWRDRFLLAVMYFAGLRVGETLGLRLSDLHFAERSGALGCSYPGAHLHVVPRANVNGARVKNERAGLCRSRGRWSARLITICAASGTRARRRPAAISCS